MAAKSENADATAFASVSKRRQPYPWAVIASVGLHVAVFGAVLLIAQFSSGPRIEKGQTPIAAKLVRLGTPRDEKLLPRKETAPPPPVVAEAPVVTPPSTEQAPAPTPALPTPAPTPTPAPMAAPTPPASPANASPSSKTTPSAGPKPPDTKAKLDDVMKRFKAGLPVGPASPVVGALDGDPDGDADEASEGERYLALIRRRIMDRYQVPATIPESERLHLNAVVRIVIEQNGAIARNELVRSSGNGVFDSAVLAGVGRASPLPPPPTHLVALLRGGVDLNFRP